MSLSESKPKINSIENNIDFKVKSEDTSGPTPQRLSIGLRPRLIIDGRLSVDNKCNESPEHSLTTTPSTPKRLSDDIEDQQSMDRHHNKELSPLFKRIKKENNTCLLFDSKQFIKQELDTELDFNSRQPFVNMFSKLSLDRSGMSAPESSTAYQLNMTSSSAHPEANELSDVLKQLNICHKQGSDQSTSTQLNPKLKKKKNKKSKKSREKKLKVTKNVFKTAYNTKTRVKSSTVGHKKEPKPSSGYLFKIQSQVIKELKVSASGGLSADEVQSLIALKNDGVVRKHRKPTQLFKCLLCAQRFPDLTAAEEHIRSDSHLKHKCEQRFSRMDSMLALDLGQNTDIEVLLSRRRVLQQMSNKTKELLYSKGVRVKDGFGCNAYVCVDCPNESFHSLESVFDHINSKTRLLDCFGHLKLEADGGGNSCDNPMNTVLESSADLKQVFTDLSIDQLNLLFDSEGIIKRVHKRSRTKRLKYFCGLCQKYRNTDYEMFRHINDLGHLSAKTRNAIKSRLQS